MLVVCRPHTHLFIILFLYFSRAELIPWWSWFWLSVCWYRAEDVWHVSSLSPGLSLNSSAEASCISAQYSPSYATCIHNINFLLTAQIYFQLGPTFAVELITSTFNEIRWTKRFRTNTYLSLFMAVSCAFKALYGPETFITGCLKIRIVFLNNLFNLISFSVSLEPNNVLNYFRYHPYIKFPSLLSSYIIPTSRSSSFSLVPHQSSNLLRSQHFFFVSMPFSIPTLSTLLFFKLSFYIYLFSSLYMLTPSTVIYYLSSHI